MGTVFKKQTTRTLPVGADIFTKSGQRFARWKAGKRTRTAKLTTGRDGSERIVTESGTYFAKFRDGQGIEQTLPTGCRDETAARSVLGELERRAELVKSGVMSSTEDAIADHQAVPIAQHFETFAESLRAKGCTADHRAKTERYLKRLAEQCEFRRLGDLKKETFERWIVQRQNEKWSARNRNAYQTALVTFCNWCVENKRLMANPLVGLSKANEKADRRRVRRAMNEDELGRLLFVCRWRPLAEFGRVPTKKKDLPTDAGRKTWQYAPLTFDDITAALERARHQLRNNPELPDKLEWLGRERSLVYKTLILTGLRKSELAALRVNQLQLDGSHPHIVLNAADEKNREGNSIPLRQDLADDLRKWIDDRQQRDTKPTLRIADAAGRVAECLAESLVFVVPDALVKILKRDLKAAGIADKDDRGRVLDVHALRTSFGTLLSVGGVPLRTAQAAMRHSDPKLTANIYTDPRLLDVHSALDALPMLPLDSSPIKNSQTMRATGTDGKPSNLVVLTVALTHDFSSPTVSFRGTMPNQRADFDGQPLLVVSADAVKKKHPLSSSDSECCSIARRGFEPRLSDSESLVLPLHHQAGYSCGAGIYARNPLSPRVSGRPNGASIGLSDVSVCA